MKNTILKSIFALFLAFMAFPMMGQDFMNIYFKNGDFRKFYLENVTEITTSKFDANGVQHSDIDYQHITTIYDRYVYSLEDVDSITFSKVDEEKAEKNFISAMPNLFSAIEECETIEDVNGKIDQIKTIEGIEDVWIDSNKLYVSIEEGEMFSFHFGHDADLSAETAQNLANQFKALAPKMAKIIKPDGTPLKFVIANQRHNDESVSQKDCREEYNLLIKHLNESGIDAHYEDNPTVDFFYANSKDPEHLNFYDYDIVLLSTHGSYGYIKIKNTILFGGRESSQKFHSFISSEDIIQVPKEPYSDWWEHYYNQFKDWRKNNVPYQDITNEHINFSFHSEIRDGKKMWVAHPELTEYFFKDIASGKFENPNSIFLNCACESLKGDNGPSHSLAEILFVKGLGAYAGYTREAYYGPFTYTFILYNMLRGASLGKSHELLPEYCKDESKAKGTDNAILEIFDSSGNMPSDFYLLPTTTVQLNETLVNQEYLNNQSVTLHGFTTLSDYRPRWDGFVPSEIELGFELGPTPDLDRTLSYNSPIEKHFVNNELGNCEFELPISNLKQGQTYYYRSYTYDGQNNNYGDCYSFTLYSPPILSENTISILVGNTGNIRISSGSGEYEAISSNPEVATATISNLHENYAILLINTLKPGAATITVKDIKSGQTAEIAVTVLDHLSFAISENIDLKVGESSTVDIISGSGSYSIEKIEPTGVVAASISENHISIEALTAGTATITVKDDKSEETAAIEVKVIWEHLSFAISGNIDLKVGESSTVDITSGSGSYSIEKIEPTGVVTASISENHISIEALSAGTATITVKDDKSGETASIEVTVQVKDIPAEAIDLGLPSGTLWASYNVGATKPEEYGGYYAWGETEEKEVYYWTTYSHCDGVANSCHDIGTDISGTQYDVAHVRWGNEWRMPTAEEFKELVYKCDHQVTTQNGVYGFKFTGPNGNSIFFPAAGYRFNTGVNKNGSSGEYWSSTVRDNKNYAYDTSMSVDYVYWDCYINRFAGLPVRPVKNSEPALEDLVLSSTSPISLKAGETYAVQIISGNGIYSFENTNPKVATYEIEGNTVNIVAVSAGTTTITVKDDKSGQTAPIEVTVTENSGPVSYLTCPDDHHPHLIDLGLPSGTKWACCNVDDDHSKQSPTNYGSYYAWGEVTGGKDYYDWSTYTHCDGTKETCHDLGSDIAGTQYDVAHYQWGGSWVMPTHEQLDELVDNCTYTWTTLNGVNGGQFTGSNGGTIFLPAAGQRMYDDLYLFSSYGDYWSSTQYPSNSRSAYYLNIDSFYSDSSSHYRHIGSSVRPVSK